MTATPWDDDRLGAAFAAMATRHPTPVDLLSPTLSAVASRRSRFAWGGLVGAAAMVAITIAVVGGLLLGSQGLRQTAGSSPSEKASASGTASSAPGPTSGGLALTTITVSDAISVRDRGVDDREIAVRGWYVDGGVLPCASDPSIVDALQPSCNDDRVWLMQAPEAVFVDRPDGGEVMNVPSPAFNPDLDGVRRSALLTRPSDGRPQPVELILVGHFDDRGATGCPAVATQVCRDRFVVTQVWTADGRSELATTASPSPAMPASADAPLGLHVQSVAEAIAVRDSGVDDREIAVRGWFTDGLTAACMGRSGQIVVHPLQMTCEDRQTWLMQDPEVLAFPGTSSALPGPPAGPALNPDFDGLDRGWIPQLSAETPMPLTEVVLLGHFDDRRSATCPTTSVTACQDRFVVDRVQSVNGVEQPISDQAPDPALAVPSSDDIQRLVDSIVPDGQVLSILTIRLRDLPRQEPSIEISAGPASPAASDEPISRSKLGDLPGPIVVSIARVLEAGRVVTYVEQAQTGVWRIADDGSTVLVVGVSN